MIRLEGKKDKQQALFILYLIAFCFITNLFKYFETSQGLAYLTSITFLFVAIDKEEIY